MTRVELLYIHQDEHGLDWLSVLSVHPSGLSHPFHSIGNPNGVAIGFGKIKLNNSDTNEARFNACRLMESMDAVRK